MSPVIAIIIIVMGVGQWSDHYNMKDLHQEIAELRYEVINLERQINAPK